MKDELLKIASMLGRVIQKNNKDVISSYKKNVASNNINTARIISDELVDYMAEVNDGSKKAVERVRIATDLYDKTMEYYEEHCQYGI